MRGDDPDALEAIDAAAVLDFVLDFMEDEEAGAVRQLSEYLARFPEAEEAVAREYLERCRNGASPFDRDAADDQQELDLVIGGRYEMLDVLGAGGQGSVFEAVDRKLSRRVALKRLDARRITEVRRRRFRREAEAISRLDHPGIAEVLDADFDGDPYLVMRLIPGTDLATALRMCRANAGVDRRQSALQVPPTSPREVDVLLRYFTEAALALHAAHEGGVIHRDVKPANLMVRPDGAAVLLDFGLATVADDEALTVDGSSMGTPEYMAPEVVTEGVQAADCRSDVYSLGVTLSECLTGQRPFRAPTGVALQRAIVDGIPASRARRHSLVHDDLATVVETAMDVNPLRRYPTASDFAADLVRVRKREPILAKPAGPLRRLRRWAEREPRLALALALSFTLLTVGLAQAVTGIQTRDRLIAAKEAALHSKQRARDYAVAQLYAARSEDLVSEDPAAALASAMEAANLHSDRRTRSALYAPLFACRLERRFDADGARSMLDAALSPSGTELAALADDGAVWCWSLGNEREGRRVDHGLEAAEHVAWSEGGDALLVGCDGGRVFVDPRGGHVSADGADRVSFALERTTPVVARRNGATRVQLEWQCAGELHRHEVALDGTGPVVAAASPDGKLLAVASAPGALVIVDAISGAIRMRQRGRFIPSGLQWSRSGERVVMPTRSASVYVWAVGRKDGLRQLTCGGAAILAAWFTSNGRWALVVSADGMLRVEPVHASGRPPSATVLVPSGEPPLDVTPSSTGDGFVVQTSKGELTAWRVDGSGAILRVGRMASVRPVGGVHLDREGDTVAWIDESNAVQTWRPATGDLDVLPAAAQRIALSPDGSLLAIVEPSRRIQIIGRDLSPDHPARFETPIPPPFRSAELPRVTAMEFDATSKLLAVAYDPGIAAVFRVRDGQLLAGPVKVSRVDRLRWSADSQRVITARAHAAGSLRSFDLVTGRVTPHQVGREAGLVDLAVDPSGKEIVIASLDGQARVYAEGFEPVTRFGLHRAPLSCVALGTQGLAISGDVDGHSYLWPLDPVPLARDRVPRGVDSWERSSVEGRLPSDGR